MPPKVRILPGAQMKNKRPPSWRPFACYTLANMSSSKSKLQTLGLRTWIEIDRKAIAHNFKTFRKLVPKETKLLAVVKSNAYGHNLTEFAEEAARLGADMLGVDSLVEALALRKAHITTPILVLGYTLPELYPEAHARNVAITVSSWEALRGAARAGARQPLTIHLKVDTGMHRQGFLLGDLPKIVAFLERNRAKVHLGGLYTHFAGAKDPDDRAYTIEQLQEFFMWRDALVKAGFSPIVHAGATAGMLLYPEAHFDMVRVGIGMYGVWPSDAAKKKLHKALIFTPVLSWKAMVSEVKKIPKGSSVGYDRTHRVKRDTILAVCPVGYWHGYPRALSSKGSVLLRGKRAPVLGRVSMDMIVVDVTGIVGVRVGDEVTLIGTNGREYISADGVAKAAGTSAYELLTRLNPLIRRIYQ